MPLRAGICASRRVPESAIVLGQGGGPLISRGGAPAAMNTMPWLGVSTCCILGGGPWNCRVPSLHCSWTASALVPSEQGITGVILVGTGATPGAHGDRPVNLGLGGHRRPERPVVGQLHFVEDAGVRGVMIAPLSLFGTLVQCYAQASGHSDSPACACATATRAA